MLFHIFEHFRIACALHEHIHFRRIDGLALHEHARHIVKDAAVFREQLLRARILPFDDGAHFAVDGRGSLLGITVALLEISAEEDGTVAAVADGADLFAHAPFGDHLTRHVRDLTDVARCARAEIVDDQLFRNSAAQRHTDLVVQLIDRIRAVVRVGAGEGVACRHAAGNNGHFVNIIVVHAQLSKDRVTRFVIGGTLLVRFGDDTALLLRPHDDFVNSFIKLEIADGALSCTRRKDGCFVQKVCNIRAREAARHAGDDLEIDVGSQRLIAGMDFEDRLSALDVGKVDVDLTIEPAGTKQGVVENVRTVGRRHDDDTFIGLKAVHLHEDLVKSLFPLVVTASEARPTLSADGVDLVDKDDTGLVAFRGIKQVAHTRSTDADVHFHEVGAADREKGNARLACDCLRKKCLARSGRPHKQNPLGDLRPEVGELLGRFEELDDFF